MLTEQWVSSGSREAVKAAFPLPELLPTVGGTAGITTEGTVCRRDYPTNTQFLCEYISEG